MGRLFKGRVDEIAEKCKRYGESIGGIPGLASSRSRHAFAHQCIDSLRRVHFVHAIQERALDPNRTNPASASFDPLRAAVIKKREGDFEEAAWLVFLATHFGKHRKRGWETTAQIYAGADPGSPWTYERIEGELGEFLGWLDNAEGEIERFVGNHRKYLSLSATKPIGTGATISSYVEWAGRFGSQRNAIQSHIEAANGDECAAFSLLYESLRQISGFGRTARFDLLCMLQKIGLANVAPDRAYLEEATGPLRGAALLFRGTSADTRGKRELDNALCDLGAALGLPPNIMEDAVCNWQKDPERYLPFRG